MKKEIFTLLIFLFVTCSVYGQGHFLPYGKSGIGFGAGYSTSKNVNGFSGSAGYSFAGTFDVGFGAGFFDYKNDLLGYDITSTTISPSVSYYPIKQGETIPVSFSLTAAFLKQTYSSDYFEDNNLELNGEFYSIGGKLFRKFALTSSIKLQPLLGISYVTGHLNLKDKLGNTDSDKIEDTVYEIVLSLMLSITQNGILVVSPNIGFNDDVTSYALSVMYVLSIGK